MRHIPSSSPEGPCKLFEAHGLTAYGLFPHKPLQEQAPVRACTKKAQRFALSFKLFAEREGFEPPEPRSSTVFKTAVIDHSTTSPSRIGTANLENYFKSAKYFSKKTLFAKRAFMKPRELIHKPEFALIARLGVRRFKRVSESYAEDELVAFAEAELIHDLADFRIGTDAL